ncbi:MAG: Glycerophosphoryl diester phosphodiesterase [Verrucomicrobiales bacterium]|nr:Glycerophosphoryl diester phosphodiesterase [Verrucomicrobiales bacterium]
MANVRCFVAGAVLVVFLTYGCSAFAAPRSQPEKRGSVASSPVSKTNPIVDLVLIYDTGGGRVPWTTNSFKPYVYREENGKFEWLFDGFLFIDFLAPSGARLCPITNNKNATQRDWQELIDHYFQEGQSISVLETLLDSLEAKGHHALRKRQVVITLPTPIVGAEPWGEFAGKKMDFHKSGDQVKAAQWYVDQVLKRWQEKKFKHLELAGFYWVFERAWKDHHSLEIARDLQSKGCFLYWIPSWPQGRKTWPEYGFDFVYQQPNYFFHRQPTPSDRLEEACRFAESCGTSMEMEFNKSLLDHPEFLTYFDEYLQAYEKHGVWEKKPVAYYEGHDGWFEMAASKNPAVKSRYNALADIVVKRQKKRDAGFIFRQEEK